MGRVALQQRVLAWVPSRRYTPHRLHKHQHTREHHKKDTQNQHGHTAILETGLVYFFYRPKARLENDPYRLPHDLDDVSRLYVLLSPKGEDPVAPKQWVKLAKEGPSPAAVINQKTHPLHKRLLVIPRKKLPDIDQHERLLGVVAKVGNLHDVRKVLEEGDGTRKINTDVGSGGGAQKRQLVPEVRAVGEGVYGIVEHERHTHLAFVLELPHEPGEVQRCFNIPKEGSYHIVVRNPVLKPPTDELPPAPHVGEDRRARDLAAAVERDVQAYLSGLAPLPEEPAESPPPAPTTTTFVPVNPPTLLDEEGAQVILVGAAARLDQELGRAGRVLKGVEEVDERYFLRSGSKPFEELHLHKRLHSSAPPLSSGEWA